MKIVRTSGAALVDNHALLSGAAVWFDGLREPHPLTLTYEDYVPDPDRIPGQNGRPACCGYVARTVVDFDGPDAQSFGSCPDFIFEGRRWVFAEIGSSVREDHPDLAAAFITLWEMCRDGTDNFG